MKTGNPFSNEISNVAGCSRAVRVVRSTMVAVSKSRGGARSSNEAQAPGNCHVDDASSAFSGGFTPGTGGGLDESLFVALMSFSSSPFSSSLSFLCCPFFHLFLFRLSFCSCSVMFGFVVSVSTFMLGFVLTLASTLQSLLHMVLRSRIMAHTSSSLKTSS